MNSERGDSGSGFSRPTAVILALCPGLAISTHLVHAVVFGALTGLVLVCSNVIMTAARELFSRESRLAAGFVIIAGLVSVFDLLLQIHLPRIAAELGMYVPLIAMSCIVIDRARIEHVRLGVAALDALVTSLAYSAVLILVATVRELIGLGTLTLLPLADFGGVLEVPLFSRAPLRMLAMAPGAFLVVGYLLGMYNWLAARLRRRSQSEQPASEGVTE